MFQALQHLLLYLLLHRVKRTAVVVWKSRVDELATGLIKTRQVGAAILAVCSSVLHSRSPCHFV